MLREFEEELEGLNSGEEQDSNRHIRALKANLDVERT
jgi:hypothetical protein